MNYLSVDQLSKRYGERILFEDISFGLAKGDKVALIANNGTGKSTLLRILSGEDVADGGDFAFRQGIRIAFLDQDPSMLDAQTIDAYVKTANKDIHDLKQRFEELSAQAADGDPETIAALERVQAQMDVRKAWDYDRRLKATLSKLGIEDLSQRVDTLSGGQKKRVALAATLVDEPELLILDEPTNHLDVDMVEWLEEFLIQSSMTLLMVTHDRYFLDRVCNVILELHQRKLYRHDGNYAFFLQKRAERQEVSRIEQDKAGRLMKKELEWMRRQPKARTTKSKSRIDAFKDLEQKAKSGEKDQTLKLDVKMSRLGGKILEMKKVYKQYGDRIILKGFDYTFKKGERLGIIERNGAGKSTFLNLLTGKEETDSGKINVGDTVVYGYYDQSGIKWKEGQRVIDVLKDIADVIQLSDGTKLSASAFLEQFMFTPEKQYTHVEKLSGGEKRRLHLMTVLMKNPNFLILDEPTNDLDLLTLQKLEEFLHAFDGCLIVVSHDRYLLDKVVDHLFVFKGEGEVKDFWGTYADWKAKEIERTREEQQQKQSAPVESKPSTTPEKAATSAKPKLSYKFKFELEQLDRQIPELEAEKARLEEALQAPNLPYDELQSISEQLGTLSDELDEKMLRWMELDELRS
jgi:ATP-binding cassette subfamily F protein uup